MIIEQHTHLLSLAEHLSPKWTSPAQKSRVFRLEFMEKHSFPYKYTSELLSRPGLQIEPQQRQ